MSVSEAEFSILLWALGAFVAGLSVHLAQGWMRMAQRASTLRGGWRALLLAAAVLGIGVSAALELGLQAQPLAFPVGYRWLAAALLLPAAVLAAVPVVVVAVLSVRGAFGNLLLVASGALLAVATLGLQAGWVWAAGFRPGVLWRVELVGAAGVMVFVGTALAQWIGLSPAVQAARRRALWRAGAAALAALALMVGQQLMAMAAALQTQGASSFTGELPGTVLSLVFGVVVPLVLVALMLDLWLRRHEHHPHGHGDFNPGKRRKRRHKVRTL